VLTSRGRLVERLVAEGPSGIEDFFRSRTFDGFHVVFGNVYDAAPKLQYLWNAPADCVADGEPAQWHSGSSDLPVGRVFVVSNENPACVSGPSAAATGAVGSADDTWPKCRWLERRAAEFLKALPEDPKVDDIQVGISLIMDAYDVPGLEPPARLPFWFRSEEEVLLHTGPFAPWRPSFKSFGTVSQRVMISDGCTQELNYFHRSTNIGWENATTEHPTRCSEWERIRVPWARRADAG